MTDHTGKSDSNPPEATDYTERVVGFVDILGFGEAVRRADTNTALRGQLLTALRTIQSAPNEIDDADLRVQTFSDSLILSAKSTYEGLWRLLLLIKDLALQMLELGLLIRGGVTIGNIYHDNRVVFGVGVNEAYRLESTVAKYPRIVLARTAVQAACKYADKLGNEAKRLRAHWIERDEDGVNHLSYLADFRTAAFRGRADGEGSHLMQLGAQIQAEIQKKMDETIENAAVYDKVRWLALAWNSVALHSEMSPGHRLFHIVELPGHANFENWRWLEQYSNSGK